MSVHCTNCEWEQDDFWGAHYNPIHYFLQLADNFGDYVDHWNEPYPPAEDDCDGWYADRNIETYRDRFVYLCGMYYKRARNMIWPTWEIYERENPTHTCPVCHEVDALVTD